MNSLFAFVTAASLLATPIAFADDAHHAENSQEKKTPVSKAITAPAKASQADQSMPAMQEQMQKMRELMDKIQAATDPKERQALLQEHMKMMSEGMKMMSMSGGQGGMMMDGAKDTKSHKKGSAENCPMMGEHGMMGKRMDMMQMMMEQMMQHQQVIESSTK